MGSANQSFPSKYNILITSCSWARWAHLDAEEVLCARDVPSLARKAA